MRYKKQFAWTMIVVLLATSAVAFAKVFNDAKELPLDIFRHWWGVVPFVPLVLAIIMALMTFNKEDE